MDKEGIIFDIKQLAVFDGPGIRTTVFMKGCPLRCTWCHNPEGLSYEPQLMTGDNGCIKCGKCKEVCSHSEGCTLCGECIKVCPMHLRKICGRKYSSGELAVKLLKNKDIYEMNGGGVTFSGGEPTGQPEFLIETLQKLEGIHRAIETCGFCQTEVFQKILSFLDFVIMDIKMADSELHKRWTGRDNHLILENLEQVKRSGKPFIIRIPLIPGVNDNKENFENTAKLLAGCNNLERLEVLPYHETAGAKYGMLGMKYEPGFNYKASADQDVSVFEKYGIQTVLL